MVNLRSRSRAKAVAPRTTLKTASPVPAPSTPSDNLNLSEATLRKLPRAGLQQLARAHKVKANMKTELIIQKLLSLRIPKKTRPVEDDFEQEPPRKRLKREAASEGVSTSRAHEDQAAASSTQPTQNTPVQTNIEDPRPPEAGSSTPRSVSPAHKAPTPLPYDQDLFSGTESEMTEEEQLDYATPVSSRSGTPRPANVNDLRRCVTIMQEISVKDIALLNEATEVCETAAKLRNKARDVRDLVKAERGRRERMEAYFRYWQEIEPMWHRKWLYGEKMVPEYKIRLEDLDRPAGPPTLPSRPHAQGAQNLGHAQPPTPGPAQKTTLSPGQLKQRREAIVSKQETEQRQLEALWKKELRGENSSREGSSSEEVDTCNLGEGSSLAYLPSTDENDVKEPLMILYEQSIDSVASSS